LGDFDRYVKIFLIDTELENKAGIGSRYPYKTERLSAGTCVIRYASKGMKKAYQKVISLRVSFTKMVTELVRKYNDENPNN
jgi:hypothetical protein